MAAQKRKIEWPTEAHKRLYLAILRRGLKPDDLLSVAEHGADIGWPGFTYYTETGKFYDKNADDIWTLLEEDRESSGESSALAFMAGFRAADGVTDDMTFKNMLAWYALEAIAGVVATAEEYSGRA